MRITVLALGVFAFAGAWLGPLPELAAHSFAAHMVMHMTVVAVGAPLVVFAVAGTKFDPALAHPRLFPPLTASILDLIVVWGWHMPVLHHAARQFSWALVVEQVTFVMAALWLWLAAVGGESLQSINRKGAGVFALLFTSMHMTLLGALLGLAPRNLYDSHLGPDTIASLADQQWGGAIMLLGGSVAYLAGALALTVSLLRPATPRRSRPISP